MEFGPASVYHTAVEPLRVAIAGTGFIGRVHARSVRLAGAILVGVSSSTGEGAERAAKVLGAERFFGSSEELVNAKDVEVVHICTPNHLHVPLAEAALAAGKHVVCEKPIALDPEGGEKLAMAAEAAGAVATVPFVYRYYPVVREARAQVASGALGPLRLIHGSYLQDWLLTTADYNWRVEADLGGRSRAFADIGSHWCDLIEFISGHRITRVSARLHTVRQGRARTLEGQVFRRASGTGESRPVQTEDIALVMFETDLGAVGSAIVSQVSPGRKNRLWFELDGADAAIAFDQESPETAWIGRRGGTSLLIRDQEQLSLEAARYATLPGGHPQGWHDCFEAFIRDTYEAIRGGVPDGLPIFSDGLRTVRITEAVLESARTGAWTEVRS